MDKITGIFDADGSFEAKVYCGRRKIISFHTNIIFSQKEPDVLQTVLDATGSSNKISKRSIKNKSGSQSKGRSISLAFSSNGGQMLLKAWEKKPPKAPTKYLDYLIARNLFTLSQSCNASALDVVKTQLGPDATVQPQDEKTASLALLWLRYRMYGKVKRGRHPKLKPIEYYYSKVSATQAQIDQSVLIGKQLFEPIERAVNVGKHVASLKGLTKDYLLGYHIGDGSFQIQTQFGPSCGPFSIGERKGVKKKGNSFKAKFTWSLTDCKDNLPLLQAIDKDLQTKGFGAATITSYVTYNRLSLNNSKDCLRLVELWKGESLPNVRQNQINCFQEALKLYTSPGFRDDLALLERFIHLKWSMNPGTNKKKAGTLDKDLAMINNYFRIRKSG